MALSPRLCILLAGSLWAQTASLPQSGYAATSVNVAVFRGNAVASLGTTQYAGWYDGQGKVVLAKRTLGSTTWQTKVTTLSGNVSDAHNGISIHVDGDGVLHLSWDMHSTRLRYRRAIAPGSLEMGTDSAMVGDQETQTTYPQFFRLPSGDLLLLYRSGSSGSGNLVINRYDRAKKKWARLQSNLIDGQGARNAYWQAHLDRNGVLHVSWVWRETADVATNHDLCYARSRDGGVTWEKSDGSRYALPINAATAELAQAIPQNSELINQTSMAADDRGRPYIATYWRSAGSTVPQYRVVYRDSLSWKSVQVSQRTTPFTLSGVGTKKIPISRPQLVVSSTTDSVAASLVFRDVERGSKVSMFRTENLARNRWTVSDLTSTSVDSWEPTYDTDLWNASRLLHLYVQRAGQGDGETSVVLEPQAASILEWKPPTPPSSIVRPVGSIGKRDRADAGFDPLGRFHEQPSPSSVPVPRKTVSPP
jgi:hypothetical protein